MCQTNVVYYKNIKMRLMKILLLLSFSVFILSCRSSTEVTNSSDLVLNIYNEMGMEDFIKFEDLILEEAKQLNEDEIREIFSKYKKNQVLSKKINASNSQEMLIEIQKEKDLQTRNELFQQYIKNSSSKIK